MNNQRSFFNFLVPGVIALLAIAIAGFYWFFAKSPANLIAPTSQPGAAIFVSKFAPVMTSLLVNPDKLQNLGGDGELSQIKTSLLAKSGIDYRQDIQPWLGSEITLAVTNLDIDRDPENGQQPGYLMALATKKPEKSREFIQLLFSKRVLAGSNLVTEEYKGVKLLYDNSPKQVSLAGALVGNDFVLFANDRKVLREAINNVQAPDLNLTSSPQYQKATQELPKNALAVAFLNLPTVAKWQGLELSAPSYDSQIISLILNSKGLLAETSFLATSAGVSPSAPLSQPVGALAYVPESAGLAISGANLSNLGNSDLAQLWRQATATVYGSSEEAIAKLAQPLADVQKRWGINLTADIFSWVKGEYAIALLPQKQQKTASWIFAVEKTPEVSAGISHLDAIAIAKGLSISPLTLNQQKVSTWTELTAASKPTTTKDKPPLTVEAKIQGVHTTIENYEIFTSDLETMNQVLTIKENSLIDNPNFQDSIAAIPRPNQGYIYLDWIKSQQFLERQIPILKLVEVFGKPFFHNLRSLTVSSYSSNTELLKGGVFFQLHHP
ncbi:DUF3352 domain-containing protein [Calothrix sp. PCC 7507]|uniref:DUF3352 domain-containing protein n=1 Tax=Calothrix sp. PCC 7507 TaxID=99598 RepID=UPI00029ECE03|nr:DUF3352 domain-containing protein [Calothrix sp. PCC 7507]AFY33647.1 hypothetical protein Cal7507_3240 [Calothrix sp. PCC 7507]